MHITYQPVSLTVKTAMVKLFQEIGGMLLMLTVIQA